MQELYSNSKYRTRTQRIPGVWQVKNSVSGYSVRVPRTARVRGTRHVCDGYGCCVRRMVSVYRPQHLCYTYRSGTQLTACVRRVQRPWELRPFLRMPEQLRKIRKNLLNPRHPRSIFGIAVPRPVSQATSKTLLTSPAPAATLTKACQRAQNKTFLRNTKYFPPTPGDTL